MMQKDKHFIILDSINNNISYFYELYDWYKHQASLNSSFRDWNAAESPLHFFIALSTW